MYVKNTIEKEVTNVADTIELYSDRGAKLVGINVNEGQCKGVKKNRIDDRIENTCKGVGL